MQSKYAQEWLNSAKWAASGGNAQPWVVEFDEQEEGITFKLSIDTEYAKHPSAMDINGCGSVMGLGCLALNLEVMASLDKFQITQKTWDFQKDFWGSSVFLYFSHDSMTESNFSQIDILNRRTDRHRYKKDSIPGELQVSIKKILNKYEMLNYFEFASGNKKLSEGLLQLEKIRWQNKQFLTSLLSEISFGKDEKEIKDKIPSSQLGVSYIDVIFLRFISRFPRLGLALFRLGFHRIPAQKGISNYINHCDRILFLEAKKYNFTDCFELGRCFQEIWLETNRHHISFQPLGLPLIALAYWQNPNFFKFSKSEENKLTRLTEDFAEEFSMDLKSPIMGFRIGWPLKNSEKSLRKELVGQNKSKAFNFMFRV